MPGNKAMNNDSLTQEGLGIAQYLAFRAEQAKALTQIKKIPEKSKE